MHLLIDYYESIGVHISQRQFENQERSTERRFRRLWIVSLFRKLTFRSWLMEFEPLKPAEELTLDSADC